MSLTKLLLVFVALAAAVVLQRVSAEKVAAPAYMQIFYEGPQWFSGRRVLVYSPAFRGKTEEVIAEPDSVRRVSPNGFIESVNARIASSTTTYSTVSAENGESIPMVPDRNRKLRPETAAERRLAPQREQARQNRALKLQETRTDLGKATLTKALNEAAADGWEVVQLAPSGGQGGLVYLLKRKAS